MFFRKSTTAQSNFLDRLKGTPLVQQAMREIEAEELTARQALLDEMGALNATLREFAEMRLHRAAEIEAEITKLNKRRNELGGELNDLDVRGSGIRSSTNRDLAALRAQIRAGALPQINNFEMWALYAHRLASEQTATHGMVEMGSEARTALHKRLQQESMARLSRLVTDSVARADAMRLEATLPDEAMLELESMAAAISAEYASQPKLKQLSADFLAAIPGLFIVEVSNLNEAVL